MTYKLQKVDIPALDPSTIKVKRNVLITSTIIIIMITQDALLPKDFKVLGFKLSELSISDIYTVLVVFLTYSTAHHIWLSWDFHNSIKFKTTGMGILNAGGNNTIGGLISPHTNDPNQSTIYTWWQGYLKSSNDLCEKINNLEPSNTDYFNNLMRSSQEIKASTTYIQTALPEFDKKLCCHMRSQFYRWLLLDVFAPLLLASYAIEKYFSII